MRDMVSSLHYACPTCRVAVKGGAEVHFCGQPLVGMGKNFRPPRKTNKTQWRKIALAVESARQHHPNCLYGNGTRPELGWYWCRCPNLRDYATPSDVKSGKGLRRSGIKNYAPSTPIKGRPRPQYDYGATWKFR